MSSPNMAFKDNTVISLYSKYFGFVIVTVNLLSFFCNELSLSLFFAITVNDFFRISFSWFFVLSFNFFSSKSFWFFLPLFKIFKLNNLFFLLFDSFVIFCFLSKNFKFGINISFLLYSSLSNQYFKE